MLNYDIIGVSVENWLKKSKKVGEKMILMAIDSGKRWTKGAILLPNGEINNLKFSTNLEPSRSEKFNDGIYMVFEDEEFIVGKDDRVILSSNSREESKLTQVHEYCIYTMCAQLIEKAGYPRQGQKIALAVNVPITEYKDGETRAEYEATYGDREINIKVGAYDYSFKIEVVDPSYEGYGALMRHADDYEETDALILMLGSLNSTYVYCEDLTPVANLSDSLDNGCNVLINRLINRTRSKFKIKLTEKKLHRLLEGDRKEITLLNNKEALQFIESEVAKEFEEICTLLRDVGIPLSSTNIYITGGGVHVYRKAIKSQLKGLPVVVSEDPTYDDVNGALEMLAATFGDVED